MRYSVIIPHFNDPERLDRLLRSIPNDRRDLEVLVIDDCSPDQSALESVKARWPMVRWLSTHQNAGAGAARNSGLDEARGERLVFADSDDVFLPDSFDVFDEHVGRDTELAYFLAEAVQEVDGSPSVRADGVNRLCQTYLDSPTEENLERLKLGHVVPWAKVYSRVYVVNAGVRFEETWVSNDVAFNVLAAIHASRIKVVPLPVYRIYRRGGSLTTKSTAEAYIERLGVVARLASVLKGHGVTQLPSATGWLMTSVSYGPKTMAKTWCVCLTSDMRIDIWRFLQLSRWKRFLKTRVAMRGELKRSPSPGKSRK